MNEELKIKVKVDTSSITTTLNKLKNEVSNVEKTMNGTASSSATASKSTEANVKATKQLGTALAGIQTKLQGLQGMTIGDIAGSIIGLKMVQKTISGIKSYMNDIKAMKLADAAGSWLSNNKPIQGKSFIMMDSGLDKARRNVSRIAAEIENVFNNGENFNEGQLKAFRASLQKLGVSIKGTGVGIKGLVSAIKAVGVAAVAATVALGALLVLLPVFAIGVAAALKVSKLGDAVYHTAQRFGMSTDKFQEWSYIMERNGGTIEDLTGFMETLASEQAAVIEGSEDAIKTFERLGLSMEEVSGMRQQELFEETVKRIQNIGDATERSAIAYSLFGDEASKFMNVLNMSNAEMDKVINNYYLLGGAMSGELIEKSNNLQNSIANMKQAWQGISNTLGEVFIPMIQAVVRWITKAFVVVNLFLRSIFGLDLKTKGAGGSMDGATSSTNKYTLSAKAATKAAEQLKRVTMGFDELNILSNPQASDSGSSGGSSMPSTGDMGGFDTSMLDASSLGLEGIYAWFEKYGAIIRDITVIVLTAVGLIGGFAALISGNFLLAGALLAIGGIGFALGTGDGGTWAKLGEGIANVAKTVWQAIVDFCVMIGNAVADVCKAIGKFFVDLWNSIITGVTNAWNATVSFITSIPGWIYNNILVPIGDFFVNLYTSIKDGVVTAWNAVTGVLSTVGTWIYDKIIAPVGKFFTNMWGGFKNGAKAAWDGVKSVFGAVADWFKNVFTKAWDGVRKVFSVGGKIFDGIKDGIANVFKTVVNGIIGGINKVIAVPFNAINGVLNKIRSVSVAGIEPFKGLIKYNALSVPQIPKLATGGIVTGSTIANIGENGREAVLPLENNTEWMDTLADKIAERNSSPSKIVLQVGEKELGWAAINGINGITKQTGNIQLAL